MVLLDTISNGQVEGQIRMVVGAVDRMYQRGTPVGPLGADAVALDAVRLEH
jgi:hypothetical protein